MRWINLIFFIMILFSNSCIDPFIPETSRYVDMLFIECLLSDDPTAQSSLLISKAAPLRTAEYENKPLKPEAVSGANAFIVSDHGETLPFSERTAGSYQLTEDFMPVRGHQYQLVVIVENNTYTSDFEHLIPSPPIDTISFKPSIDKTGETGEILKGYRFFISTHEPEATPRFYRWSLDATFQYQVPYVATHIWDGNQTLAGSNNMFITCWKTKTIPGIYIANTTGLSENRVTEVPLNFEFQYGDELSTRYSLRAKQHAISETAYRFWENLDKLVNQTGGLYENQPFRMEGNMHCLSDSTQFVAGIFEISGVSEARTFVNRPSEFPIYPERCYMDTVGTDNYPWYRVPIGAYLTYNKVADVYLIARERCYDCRERGGTIKRPPFWKFE